ncbi:hydroxyisourate hydrolase [Streptacidiphilus fuscans]|uniref:5-hydroxyisourate hydrolase n=1 Tax=Streptacidiphilus fuscans TaxID=2789292 RepID=A0A931BB93_9ACTN|nr:hydroxyisourate hydrolase [Streptacidiphilus fuscans]MBF9070245.1 hydroxyisourate hydrolase [Streptacidiphilus fuscans]
MTSISTHVLDTSVGKPAQGIPVELAQQVDGEWKALGASATDADGRCKDLPVPDLGSGTVLRLRFTTAGTFFPEVSIVFDVDPAQAHYHVPLLLNPFGYSVYRGS